MARILTEGFEDGTASSFLSVPAVSTEFARTGTYSVRGGIFGFTPLSEFYLRLGFRNHSNESRDVCAWYSGGTLQGKIYTDTTYKRYVVSIGSDTVIVTANNLWVSTSWYCLELHIKIDNSNGLIELKIDGVVAGTFSGDTQPSTATTVDRILLGSDSRNSFDDIAVNDTTGAVDNSWCGDGHIIGLLPNANGDSSQLVGNDGNSTDNYLLVDDIPSDNDTTYVYSDTIDNVDLYNLAACGLTDVNITRVWTQATARQTVAESGKLSLGIKSGTTEDWDTEDLLTTTYAQYKGKEYLTDPDTDAAWTVSGVDALQAGIKVK